MLLWTLLPIVSVSNAAAKESSDQLIIINKKTNKLAFFEGGELIRTFPVATGRTNKLTPEGTFEIVNKIKNRPYYKDHIPGGDPSNPLGDRWMGLDVNGTAGTTYAIHGNNNSKSIGKYVSSGCIRMYNDDIHWLFPQIKLGTKAVITNSKLSMTEIAVNHGYSVLHDYDGKLIVNGKVIKLEHPLAIVGSQVFVPMRELFGLLGAKVTWNNEKKTVTAVVGDRTLVHTPLTNTVKLNGDTVTITASRVIANTTMLPLRNISELTGFKVVYDADKKEIRVTGGTSK
ncbi:L,D-transpeptidase family protein [Paenibacillus sp. PR3]|uniref:L,D-transpeptidase family protein n=1 Tax=Paenibacillus terricola TaxID=2763503 RepID=A0ABR8MTW1_9BACL|nr:L,D-transpeptidase family protein [Paenibacillus terricola]MBD3918516.1 L,D-transpeptidase family protein [Paenibacillus terricola]